MYRNSQSHEPVSQDQSAMHRWPFVEEGSSPIFLSPAGHSSLSQSSSLKKRFYACIVSRLGFHKNHFFEQISCSSRRGYHKFCECAEICILHLGEGPLACAILFVFECWRRDQNARWVLLLGQLRGIFATVNRQTGWFLTLGDWILIWNEYQSYAKWIKIFFQSIAEVLPKKKNKVFFKPFIFRRCQKNQKEH